MTREHDPFDFKGQQESAEQAAHRDLLARTAQGDDFKWIMSHKQGRRFVWRMLELSGMYRTSMTGNSQTFFNEGMRNFGIWLTALSVEHCVEHYTLMFNENGRPEAKKEKTK